MKPNRFKALLKARKPAIGAQLRFGSPAIAEQFGLAGFDFMSIDSEHAPQTPPGIQAQIQGISCSGATPIVRLGSNDPVLISLYLDMGAMGMLIPFISTPEQARIGAAACRYPPEGTRGLGPSRAAAYGFDTDYFQQANDQVMFIPIIETAESVENIEEILAVNGVDTYVVGTYDLTVSLGIPMDFEHPRLKDAMKRIEAASDKTSTPRGVALAPERIDSDTCKRYIDDGYSYFLVAGDEWMLHAACKKVMSHFQEARG